MKILLTNDDGYLAPGIRALYDTLSSTHQVIMVAPDRERSAVGQGITLHQPLRMKKISQNAYPKTETASAVYAVSGTPADCVKLSLNQLFDTPPDLVISGINAGSNTGVNIHYSGTVGAAREAVINGIPSIAVSIQWGKIMDFQGVAKFTDTFLGNPILSHLPSGTLLNINAPARAIDHIRGTKITRQAMNNVSREFTANKDPREGAYYWYGKMDLVDHTPGTDNAALEEDHISITPIQCDITHYQLMEELQSSNFLK